MTPGPLGRCRRARRTFLWSTSTAVVVASLLASASPLGAAGTKSVALSIADYAVATASHDRPAHVVTAADVSNAVSIMSVNPKSLLLLMNLNEVNGFSRDIDLFDRTTFADTCVNLPNTIAGPPRIVSCPREAQGLINSRPGVLEVSNAAVASAAKHGAAVSGADVVAADASFHLTMQPTPTFAAGEGGRVKFGTLVEKPPNQKFTVYICVQFPKTAYGIPFIVAC